MLKRALIALLAAIAVVASAAAAPQKAVPHRIISLSPTATESLFAIGAGKQVIAVDDQSDYPKQAPRTKLSGYTPNVEAIATTSPTSSSSRETSRGSTQLADEAPHPGAAPAGRRTRSRARTRRSASSARAPGTSSEAKALVARMQQRIRRRSPSAPHENLTVSTTS